MTVYQKIKCKTNTIYRSIKTGKKYNSEKEFLEENPKEDLATDVVVEVPDLPIFGSTQ